MMKKIVLVYNPVSGKAKFKSNLDSIIEKLQSRGCMVIPYRTTPENANLAEFIREADPEGIIAAGGDGTVHEIVNLVMKEKLKLPVGIIGSGTSNDFATYLRLDTEDYFDRIAQGKTMPVDTREDWSLRLWRYCLHYNGQSLDYIGFFAFKFHDMHIL